MAASPKFFRKLYCFAEGRLSKAEIILIVETIEAG
jgi:hypothetical protein